MNPVLEKMTHVIPDRLYLKLKFRQKMGKWPDLDNPKTFNEKLQWLKLHDRKPIYSTMVDKYEAKRYIADIIGEEYIIPTLGVWDRFEDIDFDALPNQFVLKCTHDSGGLVIVCDKSSMNLDAARKKINRSMKRNYYWHGREWAYKNVKPRIIAEQYMEDGNPGEKPERIDAGLTDYKVHCFNGKPKLILVCKDRFSRGGMTEDFFSDEWNHLPVKRIRHP